MNFRILALLIACVAFVRSDRAADPVPSAQLSTRLDTGVILRPAGSILLSDPAFGGTLPTARLNIGTGVGTVAAGNALAAETTRAVGVESGLAPLAGTNTFTGPNTFTQRVTVGFLGLTSLPANQVPSDTTEPVLFTLVGATRPLFQLPGQPSSPLALLSDVPTSNGGSASVTGIRYSTGAGSTDVAATPAQVSALVTGAIAPSAVTSSGPVYLGTQQTGLTLFGDQLGIVMNGAIRAYCDDSNNFRIAVPLLINGSTAVSGNFTASGTVTATGFAGAGVGTTAGTVAAGNDPRLQAIVSVTTYGAKGDGVTDNTAAFQAAHDALPVTGGVIFIPSGPANYLINNPVAVTKPVIFRGPSVGAYNDNGPGTALVTSSATGVMFSMQSDGWAFEDVAFLNTASNPTGGGFITSTLSHGAHLTNCFFQSGWIQASLQNGAARHISHCHFSQAKCFGLEISDLAQSDGGDDSVEGNYFGTGTATAATSAAVHWPSASGLKFIGDKINGSGSGSFTEGLWVDLKYGQGQMNDLIFDGNSVENVLDSGLIVTYDGTHNNTGQGLNTIEVAGANQFFNCAVAAMTFFRYPAGTTPTLGSQRLHVTGAIMKDCPTGIWVGPVVDLNIAENHYAAGVVHPVYLDGNSASTGYIAAQHRNDSGYLIETNGVIGVRAVYSSRDMVPVLSTSPQILYRCAVPVYNGGKIKVTASGYVPGAGGFSETMERAYLTTSGAVSLTTIGTDTQTGVYTSAPLAFDVTTTPGEIHVVQNAVSAGFNSFLTIDVDGNLTSFKVGP